MNDVAAHRWLARGVLAAMALACAARGSAQSVAPPTLKAAYLYKFALFAEWPSDVLRPGEPLLLCVVGDDAVGDALGQIVKGHTVDGHEVTMQILKADGPIRACHLLYIAGLDGKRCSQLLGTLKGTSVLTVSDGDKLTESGGVVQLILENGGLRFAINIAAAQRMRLQLSSKLLISQSS